MRPVKNRTDVVDAYREQRRSDAVALLEVERRLAEKWRERHWSVVIFLGDCTPNTFPENPITGPQMLDVYGGASDEARRLDEIRKALQASAKYLAPDPEAGDMSTRNGMGA